MPVINIGFFNGAINDRDYSIYLGTHEKIFQIIKLWCIWYYGLRFSCGSQCTQNMNVRKKIKWWNQKF